MADKDHDSLPLRFVLPVLESELGYFDCLDYVGRTLDLDVVDAVDQVSDFVCLRQPDFTSINQIYEPMENNCKFRN